MLWWKSYLSLLLFLFCFPLFAMAAFHGVDDKTGKTVSQTAVDATGPVDGYQLVGLNLVRAHGENSTLAISSSDKLFNEINPGKVKFLIDKTEVAPPFLKKEVYFCYKGATPDYRLWFGPLDQKILDQLSKVTSFELSIPGKNGGENQIYSVSGEGLSEICEVVNHAPIKPGEEKDPKFALKEDLKHYQDLVAKDPKNYLYRNSLGETLFLLGSVAEALDHFKEVAKQTPHQQDEVPLYNQAISLYKLKKYDSANPLFLKVAEICGKKPFKEMNTLGDLFPEYLAAVCLYQSEKPDAAIKILDPLIAQTEKTTNDYLKNTTFENQNFEKTKEGYLWNGTLVFGGKEDFEKFVQSKVKIHRSGMNYFGALVIRALCRNRKSDLAGALKDIDQALEANPNSGDALFLRGRWKIKNHQEAAGKKDVETAEKKGFKPVQSGFPPSLEPLIPLPYSPTLYF